MSVGTESRPASTAEGEGDKLQTPGGGDRGPSRAAPAPSSELLQRSQKRASRTNVEQGAEPPALTGTRAAGAFSGELPSGRARRPAPPRPGPLRPARAAVPPFRPPTASLALQQLHSMVLCSVPAALSNHRLSLGGFRLHLV